MLFIKTAFRRIQRERFLSFTHIFGLTVGLATLFLIGRYVGYFHSRDDFHERKDRIFAIHHTLHTDEEGPKTFESTYSGVAPLFKVAFPEIEAASRFITTAEMLFTRQQSDGRLVKSNEHGTREVDPDFLKIFSIDLLSGDLSTALNEPQSMLLSSSLATKYFGDEDPIGQTITTKKSWGEKQQWTITGVFEDYPDKSLYRIKALQSLVGKDFEGGEADWSYPHFKSFLLLRDGTEIRSLNEEMTGLLNGLEPFEETGKSIDVRLVAFDELLQLPDGQKVLLVVGVILMLITWINHTSLSLTQLYQHNKEIGIRKALGSTRRQLIGQSLIESLVTYSFGIVGACFLVLLLHPYLSQLTEGQVLPLFDWVTPIGVYINGFLLVGSLVFGVIPVLLVSGLSTVNLLNGKVHDKLKAGRFREGLMVFQLVAAVVMLVGVMAVYGQMNYVQNKDMGIETEHVLVIRAPKDGWDGKQQRLRNLKEQLRSLPFSNHVTSSTTVPLWWPGGAMDFALENSKAIVRPLNIGVDEHYLACYDIGLVAGDFFASGRWRRNMRSIVINETTSKMLGFTDPLQALGKTIVDQQEDQPYEIIGVTENYHHESFRHEIPAQVFRYNPFRGFVSIAVDRSQSSFDDLSRAVAEIEEIWHEIYSDQAFDYYFQDDRMDQLYRNERIFELIFVWITAITLAVTFLGIFGMSMFVAIARRKEIGVRKSMGARFLHIARLFTRQFEAKLLLATILGGPLAFYLIDIWLSHFHYRVAISAWYFIVPAVALVAFVAVSLSFEILKMSKQSPVKMLRDE